MTKVLQNLSSSRFFFIELKISGDNVDNIGCKELKKKSRLESKKYTYSLSYCTHFGFVKCRFCVKLFCLACLVLLVLPSGHKYIIKNQSDFRYDAVNFVSGSF